MRTAFVYPGQGSLHAGTAAAWRGSPAAEVFGHVGWAAGLDLTAAADEADSGARTAVAQPAIFAASLAAHRALADAGVAPDVVAGHSLGEVTAAVAAGSLSLSDGALLVAERGRAMGAACQAEPGAMAAVLKLEIDEVERLVATTEGAVVANDNAPGQVVVSGTPEAVADVSERAREAGGRIRALDVEGAFHSPAMAPALVRVDALLKRLPVHDPEVTFVTGTTGAVLARADEVARAIVEGILAPVRWRAVQERLATLDVDLVIEVGPGGVLRGLARRALPDVEVLAVAGPEDVDAVASRLPAHALTTAR